MPNPGCASIFNFFLSRWGQFLRQEPCKGKFGGSAMKACHSGGRVVKMTVAISYRKGVIYCEQYD